MAAALFPIHQFFDNNGDPLAGGLVYTYEPGSTTPKTAYTDAALSIAHTNPVVLDAYGRPTSPIWCDGETKIVVKTSGDVQINPVFDNFNKDVSGSGPWALKQDDVLSKSANYDLTTADDGKMVRATSGTWTLGTASAAATMGNGYLVTVVNDGAGVVTFNPNGSETVNGLTSIAIGPGDYVFLRCDGSNWFAAWAHDDAPRGTFKNRVVNGDMRIDQRNAGAAVTVNTGVSNTHGPDMWRGFGQAVDGVFTIQRSTSAPPAGFSHFLRATVTTADASIGAAQSYGLSTPIEGLNASDLGFGAAGAQAVTLSFRVRSSITGVFSGALVNGAANRSYPFSFEIVAANTWETKTITIAGDTSGTWPTDNTKWGQVYFDLGAGSSVRGAADAWAAAAFIGVTGAVSLISTLGATFDLTGVQFEAGPSATDFERLAFSDRRARCERYYQKSYNLEVVPGTSTEVGASVGRGLGAGTTTLDSLRASLPVRMRTTPTITWYSTTGASGNIRDASAAADVSVSSNYIPGETSTGAPVVGSGPASANLIVAHWTASAEL